MVVSLIRNLDSRGHRLTLAAVLVVAFSGCSKDKGWDLKPKTSEDYLDMALESDHADVRRQGVNGLAEGPDATTDWAIRVFDTIARTDTDAMVRRAALRGLLRSPDGDHVPTVLKLLKSNDVEYEDVRPATAPVRWAAARLLLAVSHEYAFREDQEQEIVTTVLDRLPKEMAQNVRLTLIEVLGYYQQRPVLDALITQMKSEDFAIQHAAEMSLVSLTGVTHHHYPSAWRQWLAETHDPFARAGEVPEELRTTHQKPRWDWLQWW